MLNTITWPGKSVKKKSCKRIDEVLRIIISQFCNLVEQNTNILNHRIMYGVTVTLFCLFHDVGLVSIFLVLQFAQYLCDFYFNKLCSAYLTIFLKYTTPYTYV